MKYWMRAAALTAAMLCGANYAHAAQEYISFNYNFNLDVLPSDNTLDTYSFADHGSGLADFTNPLGFVVNSPSGNSSLTYGFVGTNEFDLTGKDSSGVSFLIEDVAISSLNPGTYSFNIGLSDLTGSDQLNVPGGITSDDKVTAFSIAGVITIAAVPSVPLPSSAPMFGAALLALGAAGYGLKRKKTPAA